MLAYVNELLDKLKTNLTGLHPIFTKSGNKKASLADEAIR
jgi:hypothetical protein